MARARARVDRPGLGARPAHIEDALARAHGVAQQADRFEQHLTLLLGHSRHARRPRELPQPREHVLRPVDDAGEGVVLLLL